MFIATCIAAVISTSSLPSEDSKSETARKLDAMLKMYKKMDDALEAEILREYTTEKDPVRKERLKQQLERFYKEKK